MSKCTAVQCESSKSAWGMRCLCNILTYQVHIQKMFDIEVESQDHEMQFYNGVNRWRISTSVNVTVLHSVPLYRRKDRFWHKKFRVLRLTSVFIAIATHGSYTFRLGTLFNTTNTFVALQFRKRHCRLYI